MSQLIIKNLSKKYPNGILAMSGIDLKIGTGMFGLLGPNGAGKSTLMRTLATLQSPDSGTIFFDGIDILNDPMSLRKVLGYLPQEFGVYPKESAFNLLNYFAVLKGIRSKNDRIKLVQEVLEITNLYDVKNNFVSDYSGGMRQRFGIAQLLLNNPKLIIVDEPTAGLDPSERKRFLNVLRDVSTKSTIIFSTHIVDDVKELCNNMAILDNGKVLLIGTPKFLTDSLKNNIWTRSIKSESLDQFVNDYRVLSSTFNVDDSLDIRVFSEDNLTSPFSHNSPRLEDVYFLALNSKHTLSNRD